MPRSVTRTRAVFPVVALSAALLGGCATFSKDGGMDAVSGLTKERTGHALQKNLDPAGQGAVREQVRQLLAKPLTPDAAVEIALLNNQGLQASLASLGVAEADLVQAGRLRNPGFSFSRLKGGDDLEIDRSIMFDLAGLLTLPLRTGVEQRRFEIAKLDTATRAVQLAADTRRAWFTAIAAAQETRYREQVKASAEAAAELAQRMARVGNWSKLDEAREQAFYAEAIAQLARSRQNAAAARERLTRLMGLWGDDIHYPLPDRLPDLPKAPRELQNAEQLAMTQRLDVQTAKRQTEATAHALGLTRATRFVNVLEAGYANKSQSGQPRQNGYEISLELPLFDWGSARSARAESLYLEQVHRTADLAVRARSDVRQTYTAYRTTYDVAKHYRDEVVPLRKQISDELLLRYNGMLASVFELLSDAREQVSAVNASIQAQRDFWIADTNLQAAINGSGSSNDGAAASASLSAE